MFSQINVRTKGLKSKDNQCRANHIVQISRYRAAGALSNVSTEGVRKYLDGIPLLSAAIERAIFESVER